jgi:CheY-like chemotaxis protein
VPRGVAATILVLEANPAVLELIDQALRDSGHRVLSTTNAPEALEVARRVRLDLLVFGVPREGRRQAVVSQLRSLQPALPIVSLPDCDDDLRKLDRIRSLVSPFSLDDLREAVVADLGQRGAP